MQHVKTLTTEDEIVSVQYWRDEYLRLNSMMPEWRRKQLIQFDPYFLTAVGKDDINHVKNGRAGLEKTRRVVLALRLLVELFEKEKASDEKLMKRQKLTRV